MKMHVGVHVHERPEAVNHILVVPPYTLKQGLSAESAAHGFKLASFPQCPISTSHMLELSVKCHSHPVLMMQHECGGQKTTSGSQSFLSNHIDSRD